MADGSSGGEVEQPVEELLDEALSAEIFPAEFFRNLLPALHRVYGDHFPTVSEVPVCGEVRISGAHGGAWRLEIDEGGRLTVEDDPAAGPCDATVFIDAEDWFGIRDFLADFRPEVQDMLDVLPPTPARRFDAALKARLEELAAKVEVEVLRLFEDSPARFQVELGRAPASASRPVVRVSISVDDIEDFLDGALSLEEAVEDRRIRMEGDIGALMPFSGLVSAMYPHLGSQGDA